MNKKKWKVQKKLKKVIMLCVSFYYYNLNSMTFSQLKYIQVLLYIFNIFILCLEKQEYNRKGKHQKKYENKTSAGTSNS